MEENEYKIEIGGLLAVDPMFKPEVTGRLSRVISGEAMKAARSAPQEDRAVRVPVNVDGKPIGIGVIDVSGVLLYSAPEWLESWGFTGYNLLRARLSRLVSDSAIKTIVLRFQSPGGSAMGASEMAEDIHSARDSKRVVAIADPYAFSAAHWLGSAAESFYMTRSGMVGSIGAYMMHVDYSGALEDMGIKVSFIQAGEKKTDGNEYEPLSDRARADLQREIDFYYDAFVFDVARGRNVEPSYVKENFGKGGRVLADDAIRAGMVDGVASLESLLRGEVDRIRDAEGSERGKIFVRNSLELLKLES